MKRILLITASMVLVSMPLHAKNNFKQGNEYYLGKKYDKALDKYSDFVKKNPDYYEGYYNAGNSLFRQGKYKEALSMYEKARELKPDGPDIKYNIKVAEKKLKEKQKQQQKNKGGEKKQGDKGSGQQGDKKQGNGKEEKQKAGKSEAGQKSGGGKAAGGRQKREEKDSGGKQAMTDDEAQALLNMMQKQEKKYRNYFGKKYRRKKGVYDFPDFFNMSPEEIMEYMDRKMMDPFEERSRGSGKEKKDW